MLHYISHSLQPHSSTSLLFFWLTTLATLLISLRTAIASHQTTTSDLGLAHGSVVLAKVVFVAAIFSLECLGPDGWDNTTWRDWVPFVTAEGKIKLGDDENVGSEKEQPECPRLRANIFSVLTFSWLTPMYVIVSLQYRDEKADVEWLQDEIGQGKVSH